MTEKLSDREMYKINLKSLDPLRAQKTFIRIKLGQTVQFRLFNDPITGIERQRRNIQSFRKFYLCMRSEDRHISKMASK